MSVSVTATIPSKAVPPNKRPLGSSDPSKALKGKRDVFWGKYGDFHSTNIYDFASLTPGNTVKGPAVIEASTTTFVIPPDRTGMMDEYSHLVIEFR